MQIQDMIQFTSKGQKSERLIGVVTEIKELSGGTVYLVRQITKTPGVINMVGKTHRISDRLGNLDSVFVISNMNEEKFSETIAWLDKH